MDSCTIRTYLLDYIFDILENEKFKSLTYPLNPDADYASQDEGALDPFANNFANSKHIKNEEEPQSLPKKSVNQGSKIEEEHPAPNNRPKAFQKAQAHSNTILSLMAINDSLQLCLSKILKLLFQEKAFNSNKLYCEMFERIGEGVLPAVLKYLGRDGPEEMFVSQKTEPEVSAQTAASITCTEIGVYNQEDDSCTEENENDSQHFEESSFNENKSDSEEDPFLNQFFTPLKQTSKKPVSKVLKKAITKESSREGPSSPPLSKPPAGWRGGLIEQGIIL